MQLLSGAALVLAFTLGGVGVSAAQERPSARTLTARTSVSGCAPAPPSRTRGNLHIELVEQADQHERADCLKFLDWPQQTTRKLALYRNGQLLGEQLDSSGDFTIPPQRASYLSVDYALASDTANHPVDGMAAFTVNQAHGVAPQNITSFQLWTSTDDGTTWNPVPTHGDTRDSYTARLPQPPPGKASLRVKAGADGGSGIEQTIIRAYRAGWAQAGPDGR